MERLKLYIDGIWTEADSREVIDVLNPESHEVIAKIPRCNETDVNRGVAAAKKAFGTWQYTSLEERLSLMEKVVQGMKDNRERFIQIISAELGCPVKLAAELHTDPVIFTAENYIKIAKEFNYEERRETSIVRREPIGVVACLTPWNYPFSQIEEKVVPALLAGCCVVLKPSQHTPLTAYLLAEIIDEAGYPEGVFNLVPGAGSEVGNALALHPDVDMISFTGSTDAGREVGRLALSNIKRIALELGGKSSAILLKGGDWEFAIKSVLDSVVPNAGQTCNALTRLLVPKDELKRAESMIMEQLRSYKCGANSDYDTDQGPLASKKQFDRVKNYIQIGLDEGARLLTGGLPKDDKDFYVEPTVFVDVKPDMRISQEEIFGPVLVVITYDNVDEAVEIENDSIYGLGGAVFGTEEEANDVARRMKTGTVYVNRGQWDVNSPFGGYKQSGIGREGGKEGYEEFL
ncbi:MAG: aldehyde dehydrogenase family protein, partial [Clostridiales bacterium]|nr:aldehyde dehydrogenase family protein [Clostridiales bacterium]